jgi:hypothetical protein
MRAPVALIAALAVLPGIASAQTPTEETTQMRSSIATCTTCNAAPPPKQEVAGDAPPVPASGEKPLVLAPVGSEVSTDLPPAPGADADAARQSAAEGRLRALLKTEAPSSEAFGQWRAAMLERRVATVRVPDGAATVEAIARLCAAGGCAPDGATQGPAPGFPRWSGLVPVAREGEFRAIALPPDAAIASTPGAKGEIRALLQSERAKIATTRDEIAALLPSVGGGEWEAMEKAALPRYDAASAEIDALIAEASDPAPVAVHWDVTFRQSGFLIEQREELEAWFSALVADVRAFFARFLG